MFGEFLYVANNSDEVCEESDNGVTFVIIDVTVNTNKSNKIFGLLELRFVYLKMHVIFKNTSVLIFVSCGRKQYHFGTIKQLELQIFLKATDLFVNIFGKNVYQSK